MYNNIRQINSTPLLTIEQTTCIDEASRIMNKNGIHHLVVTERGDIVGIVSDRDLQKSESRKDSVLEVMQCPVKTVGYDATLQEVVEIMMQDRISSVVVDGPNPGIVTTHDVLRTLLKLLSQQKVDPPFSDRWKMQALKTPIGIIVEELSSSGI